jgi:hypothetical protein
MKALKSLLKQKDSEEIAHDDDSHNKSRTKRSQRRNENSRTRQKKTSKSSKSTSNRKNVNSEDIYKDSDIICLNDFKNDRDMRDLPNENFNDQDYRSHQQTKDDYEVKDMEIETIVISSESSSSVESRSFSNDQSYYNNNNFNNSSYNSRPRFNQTHHIPDRFTPLQINPYSSSSDSYNQPMTHPRASIPAHASSFQSAMLHNIFNRMLANNLIPTQALMSPPQAHVAMALVSPQMNANNYSNLQHSAPYNNTHNTSMNYSHVESYNNNNSSMMHSQNQNNMNFSYQNRNNKKVFGNSNNINKKIFKNKLNRNMKKKKMRRELNQIKVKFTEQQLKPPSLNYEPSFDNYEQTTSIDQVRFNEMDDERARLSSMFDVDERLLDKALTSSDVDYRLLNQNIDSGLVVESLDKAENSVEIDLVQSKLNEINREVEAYNKQLENDKPGDFLIILFKFHNFNYIYFIINSNLFEYSENQSESDEDQLEDLRMMLLDTMNKKRQLAKREQEQQQEQSEMKKLKEKEKMNQDISMLKQKLAEHELALSNSNNQSEASQSSQKVASNTNNIPIMINKPKIAPIIIHLNPNSETNSDEEDEIAKKRAEAIAALKSSALEKNINLFLSEAKKLANSATINISSSNEKQTESKLESAQSNIADLDQNRKRKISANVNEPVESKVAKTSSSNNLAEEAQMRSQLLLQRQIEKEKSEMIKSLRDKINLKRFVKFSI